MKGRLPDGLKFKLLPKIIAKRHGPHVVGTGIEIMVSNVSDHSVGTE